MQKTRVREQGTSQRRRSAEQWRALVQGYERSGLTQQAFCRKAGVSVMSLSSWRKRLAGDGMQPVSSAMPEFVDIGSMMRTPSTAITLRLDLGGGLVLTVSRG